MAMDRVPMTAFLLNPGYYEPDLTPVVKDKKTIIELPVIESFRNTPILNYIKTKRPGDRDNYADFIYKITSNSGKVGYFAVGWVSPALLSPALLSPALVNPAFNKSVRKRSAKRSTKRSTKKSVKRKSSKRSQ
jgi:hypothetical protein